MKRALFLSIICLGAVNVALQAQSRTPHSGSHSGKSTSSGFGLSTRIDEPRLMSEAAFNLYFNKKNGVLAGQYAAVMQAGKDFGIDPLALAAIAAHESTFGTSSKARRAPHMNVGGMKDKRYLNASDGATAIRNLAAYLRDNYVRLGIVTISRVAHKYCPEDAEDNSGHNGEWPSAVPRLMGMLQSK